MERFQKGLVYSQFWVPSSELHINQTPSFQHYSGGNFSALLPRGAGMCLKSEPSPAGRSRSRPPLRQEVHRFTIRQLLLGYSSATPPHPLPWPSATPATANSDISVVSQAFGLKLMKSSHHQLCLLLLFNPSVLPQCLKSPLAHD